MGNLKNTMAHRMYRTSGKVYTTRPPANCPTARIAWDRLLKKGIIKKMRLLDGYWGAERENGDWDDLENCFDTALPATGSKPSAAK